MIASLFLARRFILSTTNRTLIIMIRVCFFSIFIGACAFALTLAIMQGFEQATFIKMKNVQAEWYMSAPAKQSFDFNAIKSVVDAEFPEVKALSGYRYGQGLLITDDQLQESLASPSMLIGIDALQEEQVTSLRDAISDGSESLAHIIHDTRIVIGKSRAKILGLSVGDTAWLLVPTEAKGLSLQLEKHPVEIGGLIHTGFEEIDDRVIYVDENYLDSLMDAPLSVIGIKLKKEGAYPKTVINALEKRFKSRVYSWTDLNPALFSALLLEKYAMGFVAFLIALVASMNVVALLFMFVTHKKNDIAVLRAMGMNMRSLYASFVAIAFYIVISATFLGLLVAALISWILNTYKIISLPDVYYISYVPALFSWNLALLTLLVAIVLALLASWIALSRLGRQSIGWLLTTIYE